MAVAREIVREKDSVYRRAQVPCGGAVYGDENLLFIANDWHTALLPVFLQAYYRDHGKLTYARCALVIHNMAHQGRGPLAEFQRLGIPDQYRDAFYLDDPFGGECMNILKAGLTTAHRLVAVSHGYAWRASPPPRRPRPSLAARGDACLFGSSGVRLKRAGRIAPTVALPAGGRCACCVRHACGGSVVSSNSREIQTDMGGWGLAPMLKDHAWKLRGIVNGIDVEEWSPELDPHLTSDGYRRYAPTPAGLADKAACKAALQRELGLPARPDVPLVGFIGRLDHQKGVDLNTDAAGWLMSQDMQLVMLGSGAPELEARARAPADPLPPRLPLRGLVPLLRGALRVALCIG